MKTKILLLSFLLITSNSIAGITMGFSDKAMQTADIYLIDLRLRHMLLECNYGNIPKKFIKVYHLFSESYSLIYDKKLIARLEEKVLPPMKMAYELSKANQGNDDIKPYIYEAYEAFKIIRKDYAMAVPAFFPSTEEAIKFGKENPHAFKQLMDKREQYLQKYERVMKRLQTDDNNKLWNLASKFAAQSQFMREAYEQIPNGSCFYAGSEPIRKERNEKTEK